MSTTDVLSFTSTTSGGISSVKSAFIYTENSASSYRTSLFTMNEFGYFDGAMLTITATQQLVFTNVVAMEATPVFDTGSWTNANSPNVFVFPRSYDRYQFGFSFLVSSGSAPTTRIGHRGTGNNDWNYGVGEYAFPLADSFTGSSGTHRLCLTSPVQNVYTPTDYIALVWYKTNTAYVLPGSENIFWIRGIRRA